ncbi:putative GNAT family acetyltransferase [Streptomyces sp. Ag109_O5-1]|nr:putative GNAT family acetyltransferase [Streptomyces sp. Ag109_O5-1]
MDPHEGLRPIDPHEGLRPVDPHEGLRLVNPVSVSEAGGLVFSTPPGAAPRKGRGELRDRPPTTRTRRTERLSRVRRRESGAGGGSPQRAAPTTDGNLQANGTPHEAARLSFRRYSAEISRTHQHEAPHVLTQTTSRVLEPSDLDAALAVLDREPVANAFVTSRVQVAGLDPWRLGGEMWGWYEDGMLTSLCYAGANLVPICATPRAIRAFADRARRAGRRCSSIVGPSEATAQLWRLLEPHWGPAREVRGHQPLMVTDRMPADIAPDPYVRRIRKDEMETIMPACVAMFTEEVGVSPMAGDGGLLYQARVAELVGSGRSFARLDDNGKVVFKAEIGAATAQACQIQGVWVAPEYRGMGLAAPGMAAVLRYALADVAPVVSLYVNDFNTAARRTYLKVGFQEVGAFMSVLF